MPVQAPVTGIFHISHCSARYLFQIRTHVLGLMPSCRLVQSEICGQFGYVDSVGKTVAFLIEYAE